MSKRAMTVSQLSNPSHTCLIYNTVEEQIDVTCEFLTRGLTRGERCVFLESPEKLEAAREALSKAYIDVAEEERRGALILTSGREFLDQGHFNGPRTIDFLERTLDETIKEGYSALCATGDMNWELGADQNFQLLADYEAELDHFVNAHRIVGLCQYRRHSVSGTAICAALETHERVVLGHLLCTNNLYYEPPEIRLERNLIQAEGKRSEWMCSRLEKAMRLERQRDIALEALVKKRNLPQQTPSN